MLKILNREADKQIKREPVGGILKKDLCIQSENVLMTIVRKDN
jgi:hypothetical protein